MHSDYSLLDSCTKFQDYADLALKNGHKAVASTEHGKPLGWVSKKMYCDKIGVRFIFGVEIYLTESLEEKVRDNYHTILLAKNLDGVKELLRLVSLSCEEDHTYYTNRITFDEFLGISENILSTSACLASPLNKLPDDHPRYMELARKYDFLEIQPHMHPEQIDFNRRLWKLSKRIGTPLIAGTDTHSSSAYKAECRSILLKAKKKNYGDEDAFDLSYKTYPELMEMFHVQDALPEEVYAEAIENTNRLYDLTEDFELDTSIKYPILYGSREADSEAFSARVEEMFAQKVSSGIIPDYQIEAFRQAIDEEMRVFRKLKMDGFMLSMSELICWCKEQGMAIGTARGSVGGSRVAYVTDIIDLNPETWHTVFSRFCNEDRTEIGDIDIDVVDGDRPAIFAHIMSRFGRDRTARVASFGTLQDKAVIDEVGRAFSFAWEATHDKLAENNPWSLPVIKKIKKEYEADSDAAKKKYPELFYYLDGLIGTKVSQSVHPAGMVISPIPLDENYGVFVKDKEMCLMMDMDEAHEVGAAKYDFLVLKTVQVIRDACNYIGREYPKTYEIDWMDENVWEDIVKSPYGIFQFEGGFAFDCLKRFKPKSIFDMSIVTACIRPSGASYRDQLLRRVPHKNPSEIIDELLQDNLGYLIYQEDTIKFLQQVCGLSGSEADNIRRAIGRKQKDRLDKAMPSILEGYCNKSSQPRYIAEQEAKEFLQIIEDSASYQFGMNHSIAYCLLGYLCAYFRYYHPVEFITSFLNNAANDSDIQNGTMLAKQRGIPIVSPKFGASRSEYYFDSDRSKIAKGLSSVKYIGKSVADELYALAQTKTYQCFSDLLYDIAHETSLDARQLEILIKIDFFSDFGNQRELFAILDVFSKFKDGEAKQVKKELIDGTSYEEPVRKYSTGKTKAGKDAKSYTLTDTMAIIRECEERVYQMHIDDLPIIVKAKNFYDIMGYYYISGKEEDRNKLNVKAVYPLHRKKDDVLFGYSILTQSIGSGIEGRFTVFKKRFDETPIKENDIIVCKKWERDGSYFRMREYEMM